MNLIDSRFKILKNSWCATFYGKDLTFIITFVDRIFLHPLPFSYLLASIMPIEQPNIAHKAKKSNILVSVSRPTLLTTPRP